MTDSTTDSTAAAPAETPAIPTIVEIVKAARNASDAWMKDLPKPIALSLPVDAAIVAGKDWSHGLPDKIRWSFIEEGNNILGSLGVGNNRHLYISDLATGWTFSIDVTAIVTACLEGAKAYHGQATYARVARLWIEAHPELSDPAERELMIDAAKLIEACRIEEAIEKYDQPAVIALITYGQAINEGRISEDGQQIISRQEEAARQAEEQAELEAQEAGEEQA